MPPSENPTSESAQHTALLARLLTANLRDLVVWLRADGVRLFMSDAVTDLLGWSLRKVQRRAAKLGGELIGGRLLFATAAIDEHIGGIR